LAYGNGQSRPRNLPGSLGRPPARNTLRLWFRSTKRRKALCALACDECFQPHSNQRCLLPHSRESRCLFQYPVIDIECCSHACKYDIYWCLCQAANSCIQAADFGNTGTTLFALISIMEEPEILRVTAAFTPHLGRMPRP